MLINAIYLANQRQTAESLLMIIIYIYTHYVHVASSLRTAPLPSLPVRAPCPGDPAWLLPPQTSAQVSNAVTCVLSFNSLVADMGCLSYEGAGFSLRLRWSLETMLSGIFFTAQLKHQMANR